MRRSIIRFALCSLVIVVALTTLSQSNALAQAGAVANLFPGEITAKVDTIGWKLTPTWGVEYKPILKKAWEAAGEVFDFTSPSLLALRASGILVFVKKGERLNVEAFHILQPFAIINKAGAKWVMIQGDMNVPKLP
jgi:hypothetical protein